MNRFLVGIGVLTLFFGAWYWYQFSLSPCKIPFAYSIGAVDERFVLSREEIELTLFEAEGVWEDAVGEDLFVYTPTSSFTVNFVYDDRQEETVKETVERVSLNEKQEVSAHVRAEYERMVREYESLKTSYEKKVSVYENKLSLHNTEVEKANSGGGAPEKEFARLKKEQEALTRERASLNGMTQEMNRLATAVNALGAKGTQAVTEYNTEVAWYNKLFATKREFTQGEYRGDHINIYQFKDIAELRRVLVHEFGHALSLEHVADPQSVMYHIMEGSLSGFSVSADDIKEFRRVCGLR